MSDPLAGLSAAPALTVGKLRALDLATPAAQLAATRAAARNAATHTLSEHGFVLETSPMDHWRGTLTLPRSGAVVPIQVWLPAAFPDALPKIIVVLNALPKRIAHVETSGAICIAPSTNVFVDADRPEDLVTEALDRATTTLDEGILGETDADLDAEFQAYWDPTPSTKILSLCSADGLAHDVVVCGIRDGGLLTDGNLLVADRMDDAERWAAHLGAQIGTFSHGLYAPVSTSAPLPLPNSVTTVSEIARFIFEHGTQAGEKAFRKVIQRARYPQIIIFSMPEALPEGGRRLTGVRINRPDTALLKRAARGFRNGRVPAARILQMIGREGVERLKLTRVDHAYVSARGGASRLAQARVAVVGVGAVGSEVLCNLAALGVGQLRLVDNDEMDAENVHRHALGMNRVGYKKAIALTIELRARFPHLNFDYRVTPVEELLTSDPAFLIETDLIVFATGEETLERRMNRLLLNGPPRVHTWLEPLGIAGHAFACGTPAGDAATPGCLECLYLADDTFGLINRSALTAPGQEIRQSLAGCAGTFSPFSALDARRTAVDAAELAARVLTGTSAPPILVSWRGLHDGFEQAGYALSRRAKLIVPGAHEEISGPVLVRPGCRVCSTAALASHPTAPQPTGQ